MPLSVYNLMLSADILKKADKEEELVKLAFYIRNAAAVNKKGEYIYRLPVDIFDISKWEDKILNNKEKEEVFTRLRKIAVRLRDRR